MTLAVFHKQLYKNRNIFKRGIGKIRISLIQLPIELPIELPSELPIVLHIVSPDASAGASSVALPPLPFLFPAPPHAPHESSSDASAGFSTPSERSWPAR